MAYTTGDAAGYLDLLGKLRDFLVANGWQAIAGKTTGTPVSGDFISFKGTGLSGDDEIYFSVSVAGVVASGQFNWRLYGHTAYNVNNPGVTQPGNFSGQPGMLLTSGSIAYWFICNGRCVKVITRVNGRYDAAYMGFILPDHTPNNYAYPLFVGGSAARVDLLASEDSNYHSNFYQPVNYAGYCNSYLVNPAGDWRVFNNLIGPSDQTYTSAVGLHVLPWSPSYYQTYTRRALDGTPWLARANLVQIGDGSGTGSGGVASGLAVDGGVWYGALDGVMYTPAFGATAEEIISYDGVGYLTIPNIARTGARQFAAFALEA